MPFDDPSIITGIGATVTAYTGSIDAVELYYNAGDGFVALEMEEQGLGGYYSVAVDGIYDQMMIEYYMQAVNSEGVIQTFPNNAPDNIILSKTVFSIILI